MGATFSRIKNWVAGETLTAAQLNAEFNNILNNLDPTGIDDESADDAAAQAVSDPYSGSSLTRATSLETEIQQLRYIIAQITGETYWYVDPRDTIWIPASAMTPLSTNGAATGVNEYATNDVMIDYFAFDGATKENVAVNIVMPENWDRSTIKAKFYWTPATGCTVADTVEWQIAGISITDDDTIDTAYTDAGEVISDAVTAGVEADLHVSGATPAVTINGSPALNHFINLKISRNCATGTDDMTEDAWLFGALIEYTMTQTSAAW